MKLVIGGAYQGKLAYAKDAYQIQAGWIDGRVCEFKAIETCGGIHHFHEYVKRMLSGDLPDNQECYNLAPDHLVNLEQQAEAFAKRLRLQNPEIVVVSSELGCGVVPMEKQDRLWRECVGRICTCLAAESEEVVRVVCGIGQKIK